MQQHDAAKSDMHASHKPQVPEPLSQSALRGVYVPPEVKAQTDSLRSFYDLKASADRIDTYAKWVFASSAVVGVLGAGLSNGLVAKATGWSIILFTSAVACLGASLVASCWSIAPRVDKVRLNDPKDMRTKANEYFVRRRWSIKFAASLYGIALSLAAGVPLASLCAPERSVKLTYAVDGKGVLTADLVTQGEKKGSGLELSVEKENTMLAIAGVSVSSGAETLHVTGVQMDPKTPVQVVVRQRATGSNAWTELTSVTLTH